MQQSVWKWGRVKKTNVWYKVGAREKEKYETHCLSLLTWKLFELIKLHRSKAENDEAFKRFDHKDNFKMDEVLN